MRPPEVAAVQLTVKQSGLGSIALDCAIQTAVSLDPGEDPVEHVDSECVGGVEHGALGDVGVVVEHGWNPFLDP